LAGIKGEGLSYLENSISIYSSERFRGNFSVFICKDSCASLIAVIGSEEDVDRDLNKSCWVILNPVTPDKALFNESILSEAIDFNESSESPVLDNPVMKLPLNPDVIADAL
jgi:hypothetical protein